MRFVSEKAGARFTEGTPEYTLAENIHRDYLNAFNNHRYVVFPTETIIRNLRQCYPDITEENFGDYFDSCSLKSIKSIRRYDRKDCRGKFPTWIDNVWVVMFFENDSRVGGFCKNNFAKKEKTSDILIGINLKFPKSQPTILHEIRHAYTDYIRYNVKNTTRKNWRDRTFPVSELETCVYAAFNNEKMIKELQARNDYLDWDDDTEPYSRLVNEWMYYLQEIEMRSYAENDHLDMLELMKHYPVMCLMTPRMLVNDRRVHQETYLRIFEQLSRLVRNDDEMDKWSKANAGLIGSLGLKVKYLDRNIPDDVRPEEKDARVWVRYKLGQIRKLIGNYLTWINDYKEQIRRTVYSGQFTIQAAGGNRTVTVKSNVPTIYLFVAVLNNIIQRLDGISRIRTLKFSHVYEWDLTDDRPIAPEIIRKAGKLADYLVKEKNIRTGRDFLNMFDRIRDCFNDKIVIK